MDGDIGSIVTSFRLFTLIPVLPTDSGIRNSYLANLKSNYGIFENLLSRQLESHLEFSYPIKNPKISGSYELPPLTNYEVRIGSIKSINQIPIAVIEIQAEAPIQIIPNIEAFFFDPENEISIESMKLSRYFENIFKTQVEFLISRHQILVFDEKPNGVDIQQLVAKGNQKMSNNRLYIKEIKELAALSNTELYVWDSNTVTWGWHEHSIGSKRINEIILAAANTTASEAALKEIRLQTVSLLSQVYETNNNLNLDMEIINDSEDESNSTNMWIKVQKYEHDLIALSLQLAIAANWPRSSDLVFGGKPLEEYSKVLYNEIDFDSSMKITSEMHSRLAEIIKNIRLTLETKLTVQNNMKQRMISDVTNKLLAKSDGFQAISLIATSILIFVSITTLFAALAAIPIEARFMPAERNISTAGLIVISAAMIGLIVHRLSKNPRSTTKKLKVLLVPLGLLALISFASSFIFETSQISKILLSAVMGLALSLLIVLVVAKYANLGSNEKN